MKECILRMIAVKTYPRRRVQKKEKIPLSIHSKTFQVMYPSLRWWSLRCQKGNEEVYRSRWVLKYKGREFIKKTSELTVKKPAEMVMPANERFINIEGAINKLAARDGEDIEIPVNDILYQKLYIAKTLIWKAIIWIHWSALTRVLVWGSSVTTWNTRKWDASSAKVRRKPKLTVEQKDEICERETLQNQIQMTLRDRCLEIFQKYGVTISRTTLSNIYRRGKWRDLSHPTSFSSQEQSLSSIDWRKVTLTTSSLQWEEEKTFTT